jgi:hypothetical protein
MPKGKGRQDPLGSYYEWVQHRYDPGHYLGGTIEPHLRKSSLGPRARRRSGMMLLFSGVLGLSLVPVFAFDLGPGVPRAFAYLTVALGGGVSLLTIGAGVSMLRSAAPRKRGSKSRRK